MKVFIIIGLIFVAILNLTFIIVQPFYPVLIINCVAVIVASFAAGMVTMT